MLQKIIQWQKKSCSTFVVMSIAMANGYYKNELRPGCGSNIFGKTQGALKEGTYGGVSCTTSYSDVW